MNGHVFQCYGEATKKNQFTQTMEELDNYVGLHFKHHPSNIKKMMKLMQDTEIPEPTDNEDWASKTAVRIWDQEVIMYCKHATFTKMIRENQLQNCPITVNDANRVDFLSGCCFIVASRGL